MKLLIVESPTKAKKIGGLLGDEYMVAASGGHVRDLPLKEMGVAAPDFRPVYELTERGKASVARLKSLAAKASEVILATDPDREGEAISWHLAQVLKLSDPKRVTFTEITEKAIRAALASPRMLDMPLIAAQESRRVIDRLVGYTVSPPLAKMLNIKASAGRVQSPALGLVVEREREIEAFKPQQHFSAKVRFVTNNVEWFAVWDYKPLLGATCEAAPGTEDDVTVWLDRTTASSAASCRQFRVADYKEFDSRVAPPAAFTTSTLQQAASNALNFDPKVTMQLAQSLFEQGAISYHRTDSPNLSDEAIQAIRDIAQQKGLALPDTPRRWKAKESAQEAHEAIRPTHFESESAGETPDEQKLYALIYKRAFASQLADAIYAVRQANLETTDHAGDKPYQYVGKGRTLKSQGWRVLVAKDQATDDIDTTEEPDNPVPVLALDAHLTALDGQINEHMTKAPGRYTLASLVRKLEQSGIGRPATYASILDGIIKRDYIYIERKKVRPTPTGYRVFDALKGTFSFIELPYTRQMEERLDAIAQGKERYHTVISETNQALTYELGKLQVAPVAPLAPAGPEHLCPNCSKPLARRKGKNGFFWGCTGYPECKTAFDDVRGKPKVK